MDIPSYVELLFRLTTRKPKPKQPKPDTNNPEKTTLAALATA